MCFGRAHCAAVPWGWERGHVSAGVGWGNAQEMLPSLLHTMWPFEADTILGEGLQAGALQEGLWQGLWAVCAEQQGAFHGTKALEGLLREA